MLSMKLMRLIERHSEDLSRELATQIRHSDRTSDFRKIAPQKLQLAAVEVYRNLGEWLLQKTARGHCGPIPHHRRTARRRGNRTGATRLGLDAHPRSSFAIF